MEDIIDREKDKCKGEAAVNKPNHKNICNTKIELNLLQIKRNGRIIIIFLLIDSTYNYFNCIIQ